MITCQYLEQMHAFVISVFENPDVLLSCEGVLQQCLKLEFVPFDTEKPADVVNDGSINFWVN